MTPEAHAPDWTPRLVVLDIDGTIEDQSAQTISPAVRSAVRRADEAGARVVIATGRSMLGALPTLDHLELRRGHALSSNGAVRLDAASGTPLHVTTFDPAPVHACLAQLLPGAAYAAERTGSGSVVTAPFDPVQLHGPQHTGEVEDLVAEPIPRLIAHWVGREPDELAERMAGVELPGAVFTLDHTLPWLTAVPTGVSKGAALRRLAGELGIPAADTLAVGDGDNDIPMLRWAGLGVAMGQAPEIVRATADEVTDPVEQDGLATVLKRWF